MGGSRDPLRGLKLPPAVEGWCRSASVVLRLLQERHRQYGSSFGGPRVFWRGDRAAGVRARIDDKLGRLLQQDPTQARDTVEDLIGYLLILHDLMGWNSQ